jgi:hypothetical protein
VRFDDLPDATDLARRAGAAYTPHVARDPRDLDRLAAELASLTPAERVRVLGAAARRMRVGHRDGSDAEAYRTIPPAADEFSANGDPLAWDAEGWEGFDAPR